ncbi:hypothetical protein Z043_122154, partial [Scleropages formosus]
VTGDIRRPQAVNALRLLSINSSGLLCHGEPVSFARSQGARCLTDVRVLLPHSSEVAMVSRDGGLGAITLHSSRPGLSETSLVLPDAVNGLSQIWDLEDSKPPRELSSGSERPPGLYLSCFDMLLTEDAAWLVKVTDPAPPPSCGGGAGGGARSEPRKDPEQCPVIDSQGLALSPALESQVEERSLEQVQSLVVGEVLKDIDTACKLLNIHPDPMEWNMSNVQKWVLWTEHLYRLPHVGKAFQELSGKDLCAMSEDDFRQRCLQCGDILYAHLDIWK